MFPRLFYRGEFQKSHGAGENGTAENANEWKGETDNEAEDLPYRQRRVAEGVPSDLNNLKDISMRRDYIDICGITDKELHRYFDKDLHTLADVQGLDYETVCLEVQKRYDGYHFNFNTPGIYNPFSLLNTFDAMAFGSYWFATGTPSYLVYLLKKHHYRLEEIEKVEVTEDVLDSIDSEGTNPIPVIYQSGYLTIKDYDPEFGLYMLDYPNREVEEGFVKYLMPFYIDKSEAEAPFEIRRFVGEVRNGNIERWLVE